MRGNQKNKTSVFSEYQNNQNDSISSRQLQYWLKHTAPSVQPKFAGIEWTLMSTNSIFQQQEHTLQRNDTFQSLPNKENDHLAFNSAKPTLSNNSSGVMKSKSYVNAMVDLQNKVKQLQQENITLKKTVTVLTQERNRVRNQSSHLTQQLSQRIEMLEPKTRKIDELIRDNKMLRDWREETTKKMKMVQKINKDCQAKLSQYEFKLQQSLNESQKKEEIHNEFKKSMEDREREQQKLKEALGKLQQRNKVLEDMKEKSTTCIIQKYNKSVEMVETLTAENMNLKQELSIQKEKHQNKSRHLEDLTHQQKIELTHETESLKQELIEKREKVETLNQERNYFKEKYEKVNEELIITLKNHANEIRQIKESHSQEISKEREKVQKQLKKERETIRKLLQKQKEKRDREEEKIRKEVKLKNNDADIVDQSRIQIKDNPKILIESHLEFGQTRSLEQDEIEQRRFYETRSLQKDKGMVSLKKEKISKPLDALSYENQKSSNVVTAKPSLKYQKNSKSRRLSQEKQFSHSREKSKSRSRSRQAERPFNIDQDKSFIVKSCEPVTQYQTGQHFLYSQEPYYYNSANNPRNGQYYYEPNVVAEFGLQQKQSQAISNTHELEQAMLIEINKETIRLIEQQQKCLVLINQDSTASSRAENFGRMKQISEQIKVNNQKMIELKSKMTSN